MGPGKNGLPRDAEGLSALEFIVPQESHGLWLDQVLAGAVPGLGRRGARRACENRLVLVDGRPAGAGTRVRAGQQVQFGGPSEGPAGSMARIALAVAAQSGDFAALVKPAGLHSEAVAGSRNAGVQDALRELFPGRDAVLLNRLDQSVSGLVLAALTDRAACDYTRWQDQGRVRKTYLAVVAGQVRGELVIAAELDAVRRKKVRVLSAEDPDVLRRTRVFPLACRDQAGQSLVRVEILKGRRHQIRAHLAFAGHPVLHDPVYGFGPDLGRIFLHHWSVALPGFTTRVPPDLRDWADWQDELAHVR